MWADVLTCLFSHTRMFINFTQTQNEFNIFDRLRYYTKRVTLINVVINIKQWDQLFKCICRHFYCLINVFCNFQSEQIVTHATLIIVLWFKHICIRKKVSLYFKSMSAICKRRFLYQTPHVPFSILVYIYNTIYRSLYIDCHYKFACQSNLHTTHVHYVLL